MHAKRFIITSVVIVCFQVCKCCKFEHVSDCKSCDHLILLCVVLYAKILIINVIIKYMHGYKCCGLCCKCCGVKKCIFLVYSSGNTAWYTPVYLAVCLFFKHNKGTQPEYTAVYYGRVRYCPKFLKSWFWAPFVFFTHKMHFGQYFNMLCMN